MMQKGVQAMRLGALEAGGTKMVCAIGDETGKILEQISIPTLTPEETMPEIIEYFQGKDITALGIAAFGPVDVTPESLNYGKILDTPKLAWRQYPLLDTLKEALAVPMKLDTDVNGACLGEMTYGSAKGLDSVMYITIGTGIGVGIAIGGNLVHGMLHPEAGHILIAPQAGDEAHCICPYHKNCLEGLAAGPSIEKRWGSKAVNLVDKAEVWELESEYLAQAVMNFILTVSPQRIILGGGVMHQKQLFPLIRKKVQAKMNNYIRTPELADMEHYIVPASLNDDQGILGCIRLAELSLAR